MKRKYNCCCHLGNHRVTCTSAHRTPSVTEKGYTTLFPLFETFLFIIFIAPHSIPRPYEKNASKNSRRDCVLKKKFRLPTRPRAHARDTRYSPGVSRVLRIFQPNIPPNARTCDFFFTTARASSQNFETIPPNGHGLTVARNARLRTRTGEYKARRT